MVSTEPTALKIRASRGLINAGIMIICYFILLGTIYTQQQPYRYTESHLALMKALHVAEAEHIHSTDDIWAWIQSLEEPLGGKTYKEVQANCNYNELTPQVVRIDGQNYNLVDPAPDYESCLSNVNFIQGQSRDVYIAGNHEVLLFGMFTERSKSRRPDKQARGGNDVIIQDAEASALNPLRDEKIISVCAAANNTQCVLHDGFADSVGSTLNWTGQMVDGIRTFNFSGDVILYEVALQAAHAVTPCYTYTSEDTGIVQAEGFNGEEDECSLKWVSSGLDVHTNCNILTDGLPDPSFSFSAAVHNYSYVSLMYNEYFQCALLSDFQWANKLYLTSLYNLEVYLPVENVYGTFFDVENQRSFMNDFPLRFRNLLMHDYIDTHTREVRVFIISRNLGEEELFYSMTKVQIFLDTNGKFRTQTSATYVPIVQYTYAYSGYPWLNREVLIFEVLLLVVLFGLVLREGSQLINLLRDVAVSRVHHDVLPTMTHERIHTDVESSKIVEMHRVPAGDNTTEAASQTAPIELAPQQSSSTIKAADPTIESAMSRFLPDQSRIGNILDWITIVVLLLGVIYRLQTIRNTTEAHEYMISLQSEYDDNIETIIEKFENIGSNAQAVRFISLVAVFIGLVQFFRYLSYDPRLGIVTSTIHHSSRDLLPVLFIFLVVLISYGILGTEIYGDRLSDWSNLGNSLASLFLVMLGENGPYFEMRNANPIETAIFFWSFIIMILFILFNMVLAVIFNVYDEKQAEAKALADGAKAKDKDI